MVAEHSIAAAAQRCADCARAKRTQQDVSKPSTTHASNYVCLRGLMVAFAVDDAAGA